MTDPVDQALRLSELVAARFAHELVGAAGAVANGLELMQELGADAGPDAARLAADSAESLKARLQFYRMAYGRAGREGPPLPELRALAVSFFEHAVDGVALDWPMAPIVPTLQGGDGKLILNLAALAAEALPRGGRVALSLGEGRIELRAEGDEAALRADLTAALRLETPVDALTPRIVHARLTGVLAREGGWTLAVEPAGEGGLRLAATR
ncbi:MAG: histidine phosphotransferase family protein [Alphaproteobacteria bacterium]|nr:histidine phosphotransferase family protein [Alphaproteobacteria bacterium]